MSGRFPWPREHGAWAMLLLPFFGGVVPPVASFLV